MHTTRVSDESAEVEFERPVQTIKSGSEHSLNEITQVIRIHHIDEEHSKSTQSNTDKRECNEEFFNKYEDSVYKECTAPLVGFDPHDGIGSLICGDGGQIAKPADRARSPVVELSSSGLYGRTPNPSDLGLNGFDDLEQESARIKFLKSPNGDRMQNLNGLRLNQIIGGSKNVMDRMRKLSISELRGKGRSSRRYKVAFYVTLISLSFLFMYLIYQNLFSEG